MSKKKKKANTRNKAAQKKQPKSKFDSLSLNEIICMPTTKIVEMLISADNGIHADFAYPYKVLCEVYDFIEKYDNLRSSMMFGLMTQLGFVNPTNGTIKFTKDVTNIIKDTAKTPAYKELEGYPDKARDLLSKLTRAIGLMEAAFNNHPEMEEYQKSMMCDCMKEAANLLIDRFNLVSEEEGDSNE